MKIHQKLIKRPYVKKLVDSLENEFSWGELREIKKALFKLWSKIIIQKLEQLTRNPALFAQIFCDGTLQPEDLVLARIDIWTNEVQTAIAAYVKTAPSRDRVECETISDLVVLQQAVWLHQAVCFRLLAMARKQNNTKRGEDEEEK